MTRPRTGTSVQIHGPALRFARVAAGLSIAQVARAAGVSTGFLSRLELGVKRGVSSDVFDVLVQELHLTDRRVLLVDPYGQFVVQVTQPLWPHCGPTEIQSSSTNRAA